MDNQERHYNINKLNLIFALSSLILLTAIGWLFLKDYSRKWKDYQKEFRVIEVEKSRVKLDKASLDLNENPDYAAILDELEKARKEYDKNCSNFSDLETEIDQLRAGNELIQQKYKFAKAELDAAKYRYEEAGAHHGANLNAARSEYQNLVKEIQVLKVETEKSLQTLKEKEQIILSCGQQVKELEKKARQLTSQQSLFDRKLKSIDPNAMTFANRIAEMVRDLPIIDLANPNAKIEQIVLKNVKDNVNFMQVPKVDRCVTCHLGIDNSDYQNEPQPFKTHPNLELYVGKDSPHPLEEIGCTVCHGGRGRGTEFSSAAHTPSSTKQKKEWEEKYGYHKIELWEDPMLPLPYVEAGCFKCHSDQTFINGAERLNLGLHIIEKAGCYNCHDIKRYQDWPKSGPNLTKLATKVSKEWAYKWIQSPQSFRHNAWMPSYFNQSNNSDSESALRTQQEIHAMVHYLFSKSSGYHLDKMPYTGKAERGEELVKSIGCLACHQVSHEPLNETLSRDSLRRDQGPNLIGLGSKTSKQWIFNWLKDPDRYHPETRMPNLRLTDKEAADIAEYLGEDSIDDFDSAEIPAIDQEVLNQIVFNLLKKVNTNQQAQEKLAKLNLDEKLLFAGEKLISHYGCYACHDIDGFEDAKPIGAELTEVGSKDIHKFDFGFVHIDHTKPAWFTQKLKDPRIFDQGKEKAWDEKLIMPNFNLSDEKIVAVTTALLGMTTEKNVREKKRELAGDDLILEEGRKIVRQLNCRGCHMIEGNGATVQAPTKDWLVSSEGLSESDAEKMTESYSPPDLLGAGYKLDSKWLFNFLHEPTTKVRPWLKARMPTYSFNVSHLNSLVKYFNALDKTEFPYNFEEDTSLSSSEYKAAEKMFTEYFECGQCHIVGNKQPSGTKDTWAPDLVLAKTRLNPQWMIDWIKNPTALVPGTKMPTFYDPDDFENAGPEDIFKGDENRQIRVLRNYLMSLADKPPKFSKSESKKESAPPAENNETP